MKSSIFSSSRPMHLEYPHFLLKIFDLKSYGSNGTLVLTSLNTLILYQDENESKKEIRSGVKSADVGYNIVYIIDELGKVHRSTLSNICSDLGDASWENIHTDESIVSIKTNHQGVLMIPTDEKLMGFGHFGTVLRSFIPAQVTCFEDYRIINVDAGDDFVVVLAQKKSELDCYLTNEINDMKYKGCQMLKTQVHSFGQFGEGDPFKNHQSVIVQQLTDIGVFKISCGSSHAAALTVDGRLFMWGFNHSGQTSPDLLISYHITPKEYCHDESDEKNIKNVMDVACGSSSTVIIFNDMTMDILGKNNHFISNVSLNTTVLSDGPTVCCPYILGNGTKYAINQKNIPYFIFTSIINELQNSYVKVLISEREKLVKLFQPTEHQAIVKSYESILYLLIMSINSTKSGLNYLNDCQIRQALVVSAIPLFDEYMDEFCHYFDHVCDLISMYGLNIFENVSEPVLHSLLFRPIFSLHFFVRTFGLLDSLKMSDDGADIEDMKLKIIERKRRIDSFFAVQYERIEIAKETFKFWNLSHNKSLLLNNELYLKTRRFVLDSEDVPLKVVDRTNMFGSNRFILFEDCLVFISQFEQIYPLNLIWLSPFETMNKEKYSFKIVTPEREIKVCTLKLQDRAEWMETIIGCVAEYLKCPENAIPVHRYGSFSFTNKSHKLCNFHVEGNWLNGKFYTNCHIKSPEISYKCRIFEPFGELNGIGKIETSDYTYEGEFVDGKMEGYGQWKSSTMTYEGYFSRDKFRGHGKLTFNETEYQGKFMDGLRCGYGVENNFEDGSKYIGYWQDDKKQGPGILIQSDGSYFEGVFSQNNLTGNGLASLALFSNGSYYQGEMTSVDSPNGYGMLYFPQSDLPISHEDFKLSDDDLNITVKGLSMRGVVGGTWQNVSIAHGQLSQLETFPKIPQRYDFTEAHNSDLKWKTLINKWKLNLFATKDLEDLDHTELWYELEEYMRRSTYFYADKSRNFRSVESVHDYKFRRVHTYSIDSISRCSSMKISVKEDIVNSTAMLVNSIGMSYEGSADASESEDEEIYEIRSELEPERRWLPHFISSVKNDINNPFNDLIRQVRSLFCATHGHWRCKPVPILAEMAIKDLRFIMKSIYELFTHFFEELPKPSENMHEETMEMTNSIFEIIMNEEIYSCLLLLYVSKRSVQTKNYNRKLAICKRIPTDEMRDFLELSEEILPILDHEKFQEAIHVLRLISEKNCPFHKMKVLQTVVSIIEECGKDISPGIITTDNLLGITILLLIEAKVHQLGAELSLLEDFFVNRRDSYRISSMFEFIFTNFKIAYLHIVFELDVEKLLTDF